MENPTNQIVLPLFSYRYQVFFFFRLLLKVFFAYQEILVVYILPVDESLFLIWMHFCFTSVFTGKEEQDYSTTW